jgi:hypothetical protein
MFKNKQSLLVYIELCIYFATKIQRFQIVMDIDQKLA